MEGKEGSIPPQTTVRFFFLDEWVDGAECRSGFVCKLAGHHFSNFKL